MKDKMKNGGLNTTAQLRKNKRLETKKGQHIWSKRKTKSTQTSKGARKVN